MKTKLKKFIKLLSLMPITLIILFIIIYAFLKIYSLNKNSEKILSEGIFNIENIIKYKQNHEEFPDIDNQDRLKPDYTSFYNKTVKSSFLTFLQSFKIQSNFFTENLLENLLKNVTKKRKEQSYFDAFIKKISPKMNSNFIIFSNLHGAFHSLIRDLVELKRLKIIDNNLKIIDENYYIIFNGNIINQSAYNLETLTTIIFLINNNPNKVFHIKGDHEYPTTLEEYGFTRELKIKYPKQYENLLQLINEYFKTLPLAIYLKDDSNSFVRISSFGKNYEALNENGFANFLQTKNLSFMDIFKLSNTKYSELKVDFKVFLLGKENFEEYKTLNGLEFIEQDSKFKIYYLLSCPTSTYKILYEFFYDAFVILNIKTNSIKDWTISLYNQDTRIKNGFEKKVLDLISGKTEEEIILAKEKKIKEEKKKAEKEKKEAEEKAKTEKLVKEKEEKEKEKAKKEEENKKEKDEDKDTKKSKNIDSDEKKEVKSEKKEE